MSKEDRIKKAVLKANEFLSSLEEIVENLTEEDKQKLEDLSSQVVGLRNINRFNLNIKLISHTDLKKARRELISAIAAEKWTEGFMVAIKVMSMVGAV